MPDRNFFLREQGFKIKRVLVNRNSERPRFDTIPVYLPLEFY